MKPHLPLILAGTLLASVSLLAAEGHDSTQTATPSLEEGFTNPPASARPWVYYFPLSGNLTKEGITADFEAMARVGIGGLLYMEVDQGTPKGPADYGGPLWKEMFKHACDEAHRLGLQINMNNDAGWCGSGGPWITPELSMQKVVWSETLLEGGKRFDGALPKPNAVHDFYRDIAVLAMPLPGAEDAKKLTVAKAVVPRPEPGKPQIVEVESPEPFTARSLICTLGNIKSNVDGRLEVSDDGKIFKPIQEFCTDRPELILSFEPTTGRFFRLVFTQFRNPKLEKIEVSNLELGPRFVIGDIARKTFLITNKYQFAPSNWPALPDALTSSHRQVVDISARMDQKGKLSWDVPPGKWLVLRYGHTTTGQQNAPAPLPGRGLECDKLSKQAAAAHYNGLMGKLVAENRQLSGPGKVLVSTHIDSWEVGSQNWTPQMREEFQRRRGYDLLPFLPVFTGRVMDSVEASERFLWDFRQTVSELLVENYAGEFRRLANKDGLRLSIEAYDNLPADEMTYGGQADEPMAEFWAWAIGANYAGHVAYTPFEMTSVAHIYGKKIAGAEAFTSTNQEKWLGHPAVIKGLGDWAFCEGINRFVFHRYAAQPWTNVAPGIGMGPWGLHYERTQTWWEQSKAWHEYLARCQYLLQQGMFVADVLYFEGEGAPRKFEPPAEAEIAPHVRGGYNYDGCNAEVLLTRLSVKGGRLVLPDGMSYRVLVVPPAEMMTPSVLRKLKELADAGATIIAGTKPPVKSPSLADRGEGDAEVKSLAAELWPKLVTGKSAAQLLGERGIKPDFSSKPLLRHIHRTLGDAEVYFVANPEPHAVDAVAEFRVTGKQPEFWWPDTGRTEAAKDFEIKEGITRVPLRLDPSGSVFVIFRKATDITKGTGKNWVETTPIQEITGPWTVSFDPKWGGPVQPVTFEKLKDWSTSEDPKIRYYSGSAVYRTTFQAKKGHCFLVLGKVDIMAEVTLNGKPLGILWKPPFRVDVSDALLEGENTLEVKVVNLWINRLIGDEQLPEDSDRKPDRTLKSWPQWLIEGKPSQSGRYTFATHLLWKKDDPLQPSGLLGPVRLEAIEKGK